MEKATLLVPAFDLRILPELQCGFFNWENTHKPDTLLLCAENLNLPHSLYQWRCYPTITLLSVSQNTHVPYKYTYTLYQVLIFAEAQKDCWFSMLVIATVEKNQKILPSLQPVSYLCLTITHNSKERNPHWVTKVHFSFFNIILSHILIFYYTWDQELRHNEYKKAWACAAFLTHPQYLTYLVRSLNTYLKSMRVPLTSCTSIFETKPQRSPIPRAPSSDKKTITKIKSLKVILYFRAVLYQTRYYPRHPGSFASNNG